MLSRRDVRYTEFYQITITMAHRITYPPVICDVRLIQLGFPVAVFKGCRGNCFVSPFPTLGSVWYFVSTAWLRSSRWLTRICFVSDTRDAKSGGRCWDGTNRRSIGAIVWHDRHYTTYRTIRPSNMVGAEEQEETRGKCKCNQIVLDTVSTYCVECFKDRCKSNLKYF